MNEILHQTQYLINFLVSIVQIEINSNKSNITLFYYNFRDKIELNNKNIRKQERFHIGC
jgi:hypothetical protein